MYELLTEFSKIFLIITEGAVHTFEIFLTHTLGAPRHDNALSAIVRKFENLWVFRAVGGV
jgi:hypothetical protein